jgi:hypothetical protein
MYNTFGQQFSPQFMPQTQPFQGWSQNLPRQEIIRVNGENGAKAYQMAPNSSALLMDESAPLVWLVQTDGAGYKTAVPYTIAPYQAQQAPDLHSLEERIQRLEEMLNGKKPDAGRTRGSKSVGDAAE